MVPPGLSLTVVPIDSLHPHPRNYQGHPDDQVEHIARSIELHGQYRNIVVARDLTILAGHGVVQAMRKLGRAEVSVYRYDVEPDDVAAWQVLAGDNEISKLAEVDDRALTDLLRDLAADDWDRLLGTGLDQAQLAALALVTRTSAELEDFNAAGEWVGLPSYDDGKAEPRITVSFLNDDDRDRFVAEVLGAAHIFTKRQGSAWSCWWPGKPHDDVRSVRFEPVPSDAA